MTPGPHKIPYRLEDFIRIIAPESKRKKDENHCYSAHMCEMQAQADTKEDAAKRLKAKIEHALRGDYSPHLLLYKGFLGIIWRNPYDDWCYRVVEPEQIEQMEGKCEQIHVNSMGETLAEIIKRVRRHMANSYVYDHFLQLYHQGKITRVALQEVEDDIVQNLLLNDEDRASFLETNRRDERHYTLRQTGMSNHEIDEHLYKERL